MSLYDVLWKNVPEALKNNQLIEEYIQVISEVFDEIRQEINQQKYSKDYIKTDVSELSNLGSDFGIDFPRNVSENIQRLFVRDANEVFARLGTRRSLEWALRMLNVTQYEIGELWAPNPDLLRQGYYRRLGDSNTERYTLSPLSYVDFYTGREVVKPEGTFFEGYRYDDIDKEEVITDIPIFGETYKNYTKVDFSDTVAKTPYVVVRIFDDNFDELVEDYTDPDTGEKFSYTARERQQVINQILEYFVQILHRSANTKIIIVTEILYFIDEVPLINDQFFIDALIEGLNFEETIQAIADSYSTSSVINTDLNPVVGYGMPDGKHPFFSVGEYTEQRSGGGPYHIDESIRQVPYSYSFYHKPDDFEHYVFMDVNANVSFNFVADFHKSSIKVEKKQNLFFSDDWTLLETFEEGTTFNETFPHVHCLRLSFDNISLTSDTVDLLASVGSSTADIDSSEMSVNMDISY